MNVSTFTKKTKHEIIAFLLLMAFLLVYSRKPTLILVALVPIAIAALLIMRMSILRRFARTPIRQVAFADLVEPIEEHRRSSSGENRSVIVGYKKREIPLVRRIDHCYVNFEEYIARKGNPSVMVCGRSGMGKSELMNVLLLSAKEPKVVFSFKPNDTYLHLSACQVTDVSRHTPDPFQDADAFSIAYALAFPANVRGITFSQVRAIVKTAARERKNWNEFQGQSQAHREEGHGHTERGASAHTSPDGESSSWGGLLQLRPRQGHGSRFLIPRREREDVLRRDCASADMELADWQAWTPREAEEDHHRDRRGSQANAALRDGGADNR